MIDVGFQHNMSYAMPRRDPDVCIRDSCREPLAEGSTGFCDDCLAYMRGEVTCPDCHGEGELLCGLYPPPECETCEGKGTVDGG